MVAPAELGAPAPAAEGRGRRVCLVSGGTGGHLMPAVALARALSRRGHESVLITEGRAVEREFLERVGGDAVALPMARGGWRLPFELLRATARARSLLRAKAIDLVVSTGGRTSVPVALAARSMGVPVCLLEQNATTGRANRWLRPLARRIYLGLPPCRPEGRRDDRARYTGTPLRAELTPCDREASRRVLGLDPAVPLLLVMGGSQGAQALNRLVPPALGDVPQPLQVVHLTGPGADEAVRRQYVEHAHDDLRIRVRPLALDVAPLYGAAELVLCRGGGSTVAELMAVGRPALIVPYPYHRDRQQWHNGHVLEAAGAARVVDQAGLTPMVLAGHLRELLGDLPELRAMGRKARALAVPDAADAILSDLEEVIGA